MTAFDFTLTVEGLDVLDDAVLDSLFEAGCSDATLASAEGRAVADFHRVAQNFAGAVSTAIAQIEGTVAGARVTSVARAPESAASA